MSERVIGSHGNHANGGFRPHTNTFAPMVRDLQDVDGFGYRNIFLDIAGQESRPAAGLQEQDHRIIVLVIPAGNPIRRRMQNRK